MEFPRIEILLQVVVAQRPNSYHWVTSMRSDPYGPLLPLLGWATDLLSYFVSSSVAGIYISHFTSIYIQVPARPRAAVDDGRLISATPVAVSTVPDDDLLFVVAVVDLLRILWAPHGLLSLSFV